MWYDDAELLFNKYSGLDARRQHIVAVAHKADTISDERVATSEVADLAAEIAATGTVAVPVLDRENISYERAEVVERINDHWGETHSRKRPIIEFEVPFKGDRDIFYIQPSTYSSNPPRALVKNGMLKIRVADDGNPESIQSNLNNTLDSVDGYLRWHREMWSGAEQEIQRDATAKIEARREKLKRDRQADEGLSSLGFKPKS